MIITIGNTKGGVGKTTLSVQLVTAFLMQEKEDIWLIDGDRQGTASIAVSARELHKKADQSSIACSQYTDGKMLISQIRKQRSHFSDIVIDVGGRDSGTLRAALVITDILVIPFTPRSFDVWALEDIVNLVDEADTLRETPLTVIIVINRADPRDSQDNRDSQDVISSYHRFHPAPGVITQRKSIAHASALGIHISDVHPKDHKAISEVASLTQFIDSFHKEQKCQ